MDMKIMVKPEPIWFAEEEKVLTAVETELQELTCGGIKDEFIKVEELDYEPRTRNNIFNNYGNNGEILPISDEPNWEIKIETDVVDQCLLEDNSEYVASYNIPCDSSLQASGKNNINTDEVDQQDTQNMELHHGEMSFKCNVCNKSFSQRRSLTRHIRTHSGYKPFKCDFCNKCFTERGSLAKHVRIHTGDQPFKCKLCNKGFTVQYDLVRHMRIHTGVKPFKCEMCFKCFSERGNLKEHLRTHAKEKPFNCEMCSKCFARRSHIVEHLRTHTGDKPFKCEKCNKCFTQSGSLAAHLRTHTGV